MLLLRGEVKDYWTFGQRIVADDFISEAERSIWSVFMTVYDCFTVFERMTDRYASILLPDEFVDLCEQIIVLSILKDHAFFMVCLLESKDIAGLFASLI